VTFLTTEIDFRRIQGFVDKKHNLTIVRILLNSSQGLGFNAISKQAQPITPRMLSTRLTELENGKFIQKNLVLGNKPKVEYRILPKSEGLKKVIAEFEKWGKKELL